MVVCFQVLQIIIFFYPRLSSFNGETKREYWFLKCLHVNCDCQAEVKFWPSFSVNNRQSGHAVIFIFSSFIWITGRAKQDRPAAFCTKHSVLFREICHCRRQNKGKKMLSFPQCLQCWIFQNLQRTHTTPFYISAVPHFSWGILTTERWWTGKMLHPAMQAGMQCECSTHPLKQKYPASFILWEEQMLALRLVFYTPTNPPKLLVVGFVLRRLGSISSSCTAVYTNTVKNN